MPVADERDTAQGATQEPRQDFPTIFSPSATYAAAYSRPEFLSPKFFSPTPSVYSDNGADDAGYDADSLPDMDHLQSTFTRRGFMSPYSYPHSFSSSRASSPLNLGAESPSSVMNPAMTPVHPMTPSSESWHWQGSGIGVVQTCTDAPSTSRLGISASLRKKKADAMRLRGADGSSTCGICFEQPTNPRRMRCCGSVFCLEHISLWLYSTPSSDALCPTCEQSPFASHAQSPARSPLPRRRTSIDTAPEYGSEFSSSESSLDDADLDGVLTTNTTPVSQHDSEKTGILGHQAGQSGSLSPREAWLLEQVNPENLAMGRFITIAVFLVAVAGMVRWFD